MPGHFGLINGVERVHSLDEMEVVYHPGTFLETAAACNKMTWDDGFQAKLITILSAGCSRKNGAGYSSRGTSSTGMAAV